MMKSFEIISLNISKEKGTAKRPVPKLRLVVEQGIEGDAHAGPGNRQVSLLADEDIDTMRARREYYHEGDRPSFSSPRDEAADRGCGPRDLADREGMPQRVRHP